MCYRCDTAVNKVKLLSIFGSRREKLEVSVVRNKRNPIWNKLLDENDIACRLTFFIAIGFHSVINVKFILYIAENQAYSLQIYEPLLMTTIPAVKTILCRSIFQYRLFFLGI